MRGWLERLPRAASLSLYIHVPFCTELCFYCGCNTRAVRKRAPVDAYAERLLDEIALLGGLQGRRLTHLHWGGGTPSILGPQWLETIAARLASLFDLSALKEHAIEARSAPARPPAGARRSAASASPAPASACRTLRRTCSAPSAACSRSNRSSAPPTGCARPASRDLNIDLMYGLPQQSARDVARSAELAASLEPAAAGAVRLCPCAVVQDRTSG